MSHLFTDTLKYRNVAKRRTCPSRVAEDSGGRLQTGAKYESRIH